MEHLKEIQAIDAHLEAHDTKKTSVPPKGLSGDALKIFDICGGWQKVGPIFKFVVKYLLFWKPKWQTAINGYIVMADGLCPPA